MFLPESFNWYFNLQYLGKLLNVFFHDFVVNSPKFW